MTLPINYFKALVFLAILAIPSSVFAQQDLEKWKEHVAEGNVFFDADDFENALTSYQKARAINAHPKLMFKIGKTYEGMQQCIAAREVYVTLKNEDGDELIRDRAAARLSVLKCVEPEKDEPKEIEPIVLPEEPESSSSTLAIIGYSTVGVGLLVVGGTYVGILLEKESVDQSWQDIGQNAGDGEGRFNCEYDAENASYVVSQDCRLTQLYDSDVYKQNVEEVDRLNTRNTILFATGAGVATIGAGILVYHYLTVDSDDTGDEGSTSVQFVPTLSPTYSGAQIQLTF